MIEGMEEFIGRKLTPEAAEDMGDMIRGGGYIVTRPEHTGERIHINMLISIDPEDMRISGIDGDKYSGACGSIYCRHGKVHPRPFSQRDLNYLRRFLKSITLPED